MLLPTLNPTKSSRASQKIGWFEQLKRHSRPCKRPRKNRSRFSSSFESLEERKLFTASDFFTDPSLPADAFDDLKNAEIWSFFTAESSDADESGHDQSDYDSIGNLGWQPCDVQLDFPSDTLLPNLNNNGTQGRRDDPADEIFGDDSACIFIEMRDNLLVVNGGNQADRVRVDEIDEQIRVSFFDGRAKNFAAADVAEIAFRGYDGDDVFLNNTSKPSKAFGDEGNDFLFGGFESDELHGGADRDHLYGREGGDRLIGDAPPKQDTVLTVNGFQLVDIHDGGDDVLNAGPGIDWVEAKEGDDEFVYVHGDGLDRFVGGSGFDRIQATNAGTMFMTRFLLEDSIEQIDGGGRLDILGTFGNDQFYFSQTTLNGVNSINTGAGDDYVIGSRGDDVIFAGTGDDIIKSGNGDDKLYGEAGDDRIFAGDGDDFVKGGDGDDRLYGEKGDDWLAGNQGNDYLSGADGEDSLRGQAGLDVLYGGDDDDVLHGGRDADFLFGEYGNDQLFGNSGADFMFAGPGDDEMSGGNDVDQMFGGLGDDVMRGGADGDMMFGGSGDDQMSGESGSDLMWGQNGNDELNGGTGADLLSGDRGANTLSGGGGDDTLFGKFGYDRLDGGDHDDVYRVTFDVEDCFSLDRPGGREDYVFIVPGRQLDEETVNIDVDLGAIGREVIEPVFDAVESMVSPFDFLNKEIPGSEVDEITVAGVEIYGGHDLNITYFDVLEFVLPGQADTINLIESLTNLENPVQDGVVEIRDVKVRGADVIGDPGSWVPDIMNSNVMEDLEDLGIQFDVLNSPNSIVEMFLGIDVNLITYELQDLDLEFHDGPEAWLAPLVSVEIGGELGFKLDGTIGYDTYGIRTGDFSDGFYFEDVGITLSAGIYLQVALDVAVGEAGVEASIDGRFRASLHDPNDDGKVRLDEINRNNLFDFDGSLQFDIEPYVEVEAAELVEDVVDWVVSWF